MIAKNTFQCDWFYFNSKTSTLLYKREVTFKIFHEEINRKCCKFYETCRLKIDCSVWTDRKVSKIFKIIMLVYSLRIFDLIPINSRVIKSCWIYSIT